jgi:spermidine/putrescine transport system substrate-binding protein
MTEGPEQVRILAPESRRLALERALTRRHALAVGAAGLAGAFLTACGGRSGAAPAATSSGGAGGLKGKPIEDELLLSNWVDYADPKDYKAFTKRLGPKVNVEGFGSNDELLAKLSAGGSNWDIVAPSGSYVPALIEKGLLMPLDHSLLPNLKNLEPAFTRTKFDPGNKYSVTKDYGITSFYYRKDVVPNPPDTLRGWVELLPQYKGKNINIVEGASEMWGIFLLAAGHHEDSTNEADYEDALKLALAAKPAITTISSTYIERLQRGQIDIGLGWNGDVLRAAMEAKKRGIEIGFTVPKGAGEYWTDNWAIAASSKHPVAAHAWINFMLEPEIAGREWNYVGYTVPVKGAEQFVDPKIANDPMIKVPSSTLDGYDSTVATPETNALYGKYYTKFKA